MNETLNDTTSPGQSRPTSIRLLNRSASRRVRHKVNVQAEFNSFKLRAFFF